MVVHELPGIDIIYGIHNEGEVGPKIIIEDVLVLLGDSEFETVEMGLWVDDVAYFASSFALVLADVLPSEQELPVEVTDFNIVVISYQCFSLASHSHKREHLDELAAQSSSSYHKTTALLGPFHKLISKQDVVVFVSVFREASPNWLAGQYFEKFMVKPLPQWSVFSSELYYLLADYPSPK